ncbi:MAG: hypothetical protein ABGY12_06200, partial [Candidatus Lambdaproteobacteria bacterium]
MDALTTGTKSVFTILQSLETPLTQIVDVSGNDFAAGIIYFDFLSGVSSGYAFNDMSFSDSNSNGKIDCTGTFASGNCELPDLPSFVTLTSSAILEVTLDSTQQFAAGTSFTGGVSYPAGQAFSGTMSFNGDQTFAAGMSFFAGQDFTIGSFDLDFGKPNMSFGAGTIFGPELSGEGHSFTAGTMTFPAGKSFGFNNVFASSQTFGPQTFTGPQTFGDNTVFNFATDFSAVGTESGSLTVGAHTGVTEWFTILQGLTDGAVTVVSANSSSDNFSSGIIYADFDSVSSGYAINDIEFTDSNNNGQIDCTSSPNCEIQDLGTPVNVSSGAHINFSQDSLQTFGTGSSFTPGMKFPSGQPFDFVFDFPVGVVFAPGTIFGASGQSFTAFDWDWDKPKMIYSTGASFTENETFGVGASFTKGIVTFGGSNTFKENSQFADGQSFTSGIQIFGESSTFGAGSSFTDSQLFTDGPMHFHGSMTFGDATSFTTAQGFSVTQTFGSSSTFVASSFTTGQDFTA